MTERFRPDREPRPSETAANFTVLTPDQFRKDFCSEVALAITAFPNRDQNLALPIKERPRVGLEAMWIEFYGKKMRPIFNSVLEATKAGFDIELHRDFYSDTILDQNFVWLPPTRFVDKEEKLHRQWVYGFGQKRLGKLQDAGAKIIPTNVPDSLVGKATYLLRGRNHKKIIFVKSPHKTVAWFGGMNIAEEHFRQLDFMVEINDPRIVEPLIDEFKRVSQNRQRKTNAEIPVTEESTLLIDTVRENSLILKRAIEDVNAARETIYVSSVFTPSGAFLEALVRAKKRGVHVAYITSDPEVVGGLLKKRAQVLGAIATLRKHKIVLMYPESKPVHAKALVVDRKSVIIGSHNFVDAPHEELSMRSTNPKLVTNVTTFLDEITGGNLDTRFDQDFVIPKPKAASYFFTP